MLNFFKRFEWLFNSFWLNSILTTILFFYYTALDIWGDDWIWISQYRQAHSKAYLVLFLLTLISVVLKSYYESKINKNKKKNEDVLKKFIGLIRSVVDTKKTRFYEKVTKLQPNKRINFFNEITHPQEQIRFIMGQLREFFDFWGVDRSQLEVTVLRSVTKEDSDNENWKFILKLDEQRHHTDPNVLMRSNSLAKKAVDSGQPIFLADLLEGIERDIFHPSSRSAESYNIGSIFCKPVTIKIQSITYKYVFSVVSYGTYLCQPTDINEANQMSMILNEIGDRIELELYLSAMRQHKSKS